MPVPISKIRRWGALTTALLLVSGVFAACGGGSDDELDNVRRRRHGRTDHRGPRRRSRRERATLIETARRERRAGFSRGELDRECRQRDGDARQPQQQQLPHAIEIEGNGVEEEAEAIQPGGTSTVTVRLKPGRYTFYCPVGTTRRRA